MAYRDYQGRQPILVIIIEAGEQLEPKDGDDEGRDEREDAKGNGSYVEAPPWPPRALIV